MIDEDKDCLLDSSTEWIGVRIDKGEGKASILILPGKVNGVIKIKATLRRCNIKKDCHLEGKNPSS